MGEREKIVSAREADVPRETVGAGTRRLVRRTALLLFLSTLPLLCVIAAAAVYQYRSERATLLGDLTRRVDDHGSALEALLAGPSDHLTRLSAFLAGRLEDDLARPPSPLRAVLRPDRRMIGGTLHEGTFADRLTGRDTARGAGFFAVASPDFVAGLGAHYAAFDAVLDALEPMRLGHITSPQLQWSYFFSADRHFAAIYPAFPTERAAPGTGGGTARPIEDLLAVWNGYEVFRLGTPEENRGRAAFWTRAYGDAAGAGWMVSHGAPVYAGGRHVGVVATDVLLARFEDLLAGLSAMPGTVAVVDETGEILASRNAAGSASGPPRPLASLFPGGEPPPALPAMLAASLAHRPVAGTNALVRRAGHHPFWLVHVLSEEELRSELFEQLLPGAITLVGLVATLGVALLLLARQVVRPGLLLVRHIKAEAASGSTHAARAPALWRPWFDDVSRAFAANRHYQKQLEEREAEYRAVVETQTEFICRFDRDDRVLFVNDAYCRHMGMSRDELMGTVITDFSGIFPEDHQRLLEGIARLTPQSPTVVHQVRGTLPDGRYAEEEWTDTGIFDEKGELVVIQSVGRDVTERNSTARALEQQRDALHQSEKLAALGSMLAGVAHELNNPLSVVIGYARMLVEYAPDAATRERASHVHAAADRCGRIVKSFLAMARARPAERDCVHLEEVIEDALTLAAYGLRTHSVEIIRHIAPELPPVFADRDQIHQVFLNLVVNAQHALSVQAGPRRLTIAGRAEGADVVIEVVDNGPGMIDEVRRRAFEPFFTTKPQGLGTGIGLSVSSGIVEAHGGVIELTSAPGKGTRFLIRLPVYDCQPDACGLALDEETEGAVGQVLVVDDEEEIAELVAEHLSREGLVVDVADRGAAALELVRTRAYDLLIVDLRMPDMDGAELVARVERLAPAMLSRVIVMTGDALGAQLDALVVQRGFSVFEKPLDFDALRREARRRLTPRRDAEGADAEVEAMEVAP